MKLRGKRKRGEAVSRALLRLGFASARSRAEVGTEGELSARALSLCWLGRRGIRRAPRRPLHPGQAPHVSLLLAGPARSWESGLGWGVVGTRAERVGRLPRAAAGGGRAGRPPSARGPGPLFTFWAREGGSGGAEGQPPEPSCHRLPTRCFLPG